MVFKKNVIIRNPNSTRPWQHVLDPIYGYMKLALNLSKNNELHEALILALTLIKMLML